ncbi:agamous-like MADS-box protein AGL62 [Impatiens glandulifera]|uniref:agamous-like MADS-box protein AGL62 n=1 Tax=Impatiens glandulifera TaxID=253017 RepID=UPI001FB1931A|nr:agamous-like MADS-box protein AGL62 [Impatiens glandulifera]
MAPKWNKGRQIIPIEKIENSSKRSVTFSKRKFGAFKKANELSNLCGSDVAIIIFSEGGKGFSYGNPNVYAILDQFMHANSQRALDSAYHEFLEAQKISRVREMDARIKEAGDNFKLEQERQKMLLLEMANHAKKRWWEKSVPEMSLNQLHLRNDWMVELKIFFEEQRTLKMKEDLNPLHLLAMTIENQISP